MTSTLLVEYQTIPHHMSGISTIKINYREKMYLTRYFDYKILNKKLYYIELNGVEINKTELLNLLYN